MKQIGLVESIVREEDVGRTERGTSIGRMGERRTLKAIEA